MSVDARATDGYPRVVQIARGDRHLLGQLRPGMHLRLLWRDVDAVIEELSAKHDYWRPWLADRYRGNLKSSPADRSRGKAW